MNILLIHQYFLEEDNAGAARWNEIAKEWSALGHHITVLAGMIHANGTKKPDEYKGKYFKKKTQGPVTVWRCHVSERYNINFTGRLLGYFSFMFSSLWAGLFKAKGKFDVVIMTSPPLFVGISGYLISRARGLPMIFEIRDLWPESAIATGMLRNRAIIRLSYLFENFICKKADLINVLTPAFYNTLTQEKNVPAKKIIMVPNSADFGLAEKTLKDFHIDKFRKENDLEGHFVIIYVGAHGVANHLEQLIDAGKALEDTNVLFLLIGQGMEKPKLIKLVESKNVKNVRFIGLLPKTEIFKYIFASDMGTSVLKKTDTFKTVYSNKTFDYMSCGKPILMAIDGISRELVETAGAGSFVTPEDANDFSRVTREYLSDPARVKCQGQNGYEYAKKNFDRKILAGRYLDYVLKLCNKPRA